MGKKKKVAGIKPKGGVTTRKNLSCCHRKHCAEGSNMHGKEKSRRKIVG